MKASKRHFFISLVVSTVMIFNNIDAHGKSHEDKQLEEFVKGNNYIPAEMTISQFEEMYDKKVNLPKKVPFEPSHRFGNINEEGYLKLHFMKPGKVDEYPTLDFVFYVMPEKDLDLFIHANDKIYTLKNGEKAYYRQHHQNFHSFAFTTNELGYHFGANHNKIDLQTFIEVAESIK